MITNQIFLSVSVRDYIIFRSSKLLWILSLVHRYTSGWTFYTHWIIFKPSTYRWYTWCSFCSFN